MTTREAIIGIEIAEDIAAEVFETEYDDFAAEQYDRWFGVTPDQEKAYWSYVSQGYADADGYYAPLQPKAWVATFYQSPA